MKLNILFKSFKVVWHTDKTWIIYNIFYALIAGFTPIIQVILTKELINEVANVIKNPNNSFLNVLSLLIVQFLITILTSILNSYRDYKNDKTRLLLDHHLQTQIFSKISKVQYSNFDNPHFYNFLSRISGSIGSRFLSPITHSVDLITNIIAMGSFIVFLWSIHWVLFLLAVIPSFPVFIMHYRFGYHTYSLLIAQTPTARDASYTSNILQSRETAKEVKLFGLMDYLTKRWSEKFKQNAKESLNLMKKQEKVKLALEGFTSIIYIISAFIIIKTILVKNLKIGDFVAIGQAVQETQNKLSLASVNLATIYEQTLYLNDFFTFLAMEIEENNLTKDEKFPTRLVNGIHIDNLTFCYPGSTEPVLKNISLFIKPGEKIAIVGENGSGKTTLAKCLLGFYYLENGTIYFDNRDINEINKDDLYNNVTALFQDFAKYSYSIMENIGFGDISRIADEQAIKEVAVSSGVDDFVKHYKDGYETYLTRTLYDGEDLSGGQWQKIALARGVLRDAQIILLDEPTAALDPIKEMELFNQFDKLTKNKTAFFISHRMSATRLADRIIVLKNGEVEETGSFTELIENNGFFKEMYEIQSKQFNK